MSKYLNTISLLSHFQIISPGIYYEKLRIFNQKLSKFLRKSISSFIFMYSKPTQMKIAGMLPNQGRNDSYTFAEKAASAKDLPWAPCAAPNNMAN